MFDRFKEDWESIFERDRSAESRWEILLASPGFHAVCMHRMARWCYIQGWSTVARIVSYTGRVLTGIDIHPAARIGRRLFIDHGTGVVIGDSVVIGDDCVIQQGASLIGADDGETKTPLVIKDNVLIGAGAQLMGGITVGANAQIGPCAVVFKNVAESMAITCDATTTSKHVSQAKLGMSKQLVDQYTKKIRALESLVEEQGRVIASLREENGTPLVVSRDTKVKPVASRKASPKKSLVRREILKKPAVTKARSSVKKVASKTTSRKKTRTVKKS